MVVSISLLYAESNDVQPSQRMCLIESNNEATTRTPEPTSARLPELTTTTDCSSCDETSHPAIVGGVLGGAMAVALVAVAIISVCIVVLLVKQKRIRTDHESATRFHNAIVEGKLQLCCTFTSMQTQITDVLHNYYYAGTGPQPSTSVNTESEEPQVSTTSKQRQNLYSETCLNRPSLVGSQQ